MSKEKLLQQLQDLQNADYSDCIIPGATIIIEKSKDNVHVITGNLRDSHSVEKEGNVVNMVIGAEYAGDEEYLHPYFRPALDEKAGDASLAIADAMNKKIKEVVDK